MRGMHANANLAYVLGAAARYEATGEARARDAVLAFWRQLQGAYAYATGGSSFQEEWRAPHAQHGHNTKVATFGEAIGWPPCSFGCV